MVISRWLLAHCYLGYTSIGSGGANGAAGPSQSQQATVAHKLPEVPLESVQVDDFNALRGQETTVTSQPFYVLPRRITDAALFDNALQATEELIFGDHRDEADWQPAFEIYIMEDGVPLPGVAPKAFVSVIDELARSAVPFVRQAYRCPSCMACTAFVRRYLPAERMRIPAHYDVTAYATIILPLSPALNYTGGFFVQPSAHVNSRLFVPLEVGDIAVHDFTLNHGIEVIDGGRYSLVIWVSETDTACRSSATPWHVDRAVTGDAVAQHILGMMYGQGNGAPQDYAKALHWTLQAADSGLVNAQFSAATMYFEGQGTHVNETLAHYWYLQAATAGDASSQMIVSRMYMEGVGVEADTGLAEYWYQQGAAQRGAQLMGPPRWSR